MSEDRATYQVGNEPPMPSLTDREKIAILRKALEAARVKHLDCIDPAFSCPKVKQNGPQTICSFTVNAWTGAATPEPDRVVWPEYKGALPEGSVCDCGAERRNADIDKALKETE